jgi:hypothetical protein
MAQENLILTEAQLQALERLKVQKETEGQIESEHPGYLGFQHTFNIGTLKGVRRNYQQTFIYMYCKMSMVKLYDRRNALVTADILNDRILPIYEYDGIPLWRILTNGGYGILRELEGL